MILLKQNGDSAAPIPVNGLTVLQGNTVVAYADAIARLIPQEGIDYDVVITFSGESDLKTSMRIIPHTDKGEWWKDYIHALIKKYPPVPRYNGDVLPEHQDADDLAETPQGGKENNNEQNQQG